MSRSVFSVLFLASALVLPRPGTAQDLLDQGTALGGVTGFLVVVGGVTEAAEREGVDTARVRTVVELVLRSAGIRIHTGEEQSQKLRANYPNFRNAWFVVRIRTVHPENPIKGAVGYFVEATLDETLRTSTGQLVLGSVWKEARLGLVGGDHLRQFIMDNVRTMTEAFANDYLKANPL